MRISDQELEAMEAKFRLGDCSVVAACRMPQHEPNALSGRFAGSGTTPWGNGMCISGQEHEAMEPVGAACSDAELTVILANGQKIVTPLWWYPRLFKATPQQRSKYELSPFGVHWPDVDENLSIEGMLVGSKAPGARQPEPA